MAVEQGRIAAGAPSEEGGRALTKRDDYDWDVCLSFAGEDREYVEEVADGLRDEGIRVFYDRYEQVKLWGKDLYEHLDDVYRNTARYCIMFVSSRYAKKLWTNHERKSAQARAFRENAEYVLPVRFDDTEVPGLPETVGYIDLSHIEANELVQMIIQKLGGRQARNFFPPKPDRLFDALSVEDEEDRDIVFSHGYSFFQALNRMSDDERTIVFWIFLQGCPAELPENIHINIDLLRRCTGFAPNKIKRLCAKISSLGFLSSLRDDEETDPARIGRSEMLVLEWHDLSVDNPDNATAVATAIVTEATSGYCHEHGFEALSRLDFSQLASATTQIDVH